MAQKSGPLMGLYSAVYRDFFTTLIEILSSSYQSKNTIIPFIPFIFFILIKCPSMWIFNNT